MEIGMFTQWRQEMRNLFLALIMAGAMMTAGCGTRALEGGAIGSALGAAAGVGISALTGQNVGYGALAGAAAGALGGGLAGSQNARPYDGQGYVNPFSYNNSQKCAGNGYGTCRSYYPARYQMYRNPGYPYQLRNYQNAGGVINNNDGTATRWYSTD